MARASFVEMDYTPEEGFEYFDLDDADARFVLIFLSKKASDVSYFQADEIEQQETEEATKN